MEAIKALLEHQPLMALFLTVAFGYLVGEINIKGFSLGVGAVLFVALAMGWFAPGSAPAPMVGTLGLALFLYAVGIQYGKQFFSGLTSANGRRANLMALIGVLLAGAVSIAFFKLIGINLGYSLGTIRGIGNQHAVAPGGHSGARQRRCRSRVLGFLSVRRGGAHPYPVHPLSRSSNPKLKYPKATGLEMLEISVHNPEMCGKTIGELMTALPAGVQIVAVRRMQRNEPAFPNFVVAENDVLLAVAPDKAALDQTSKILGQEAHGRLVKDRRDIDYLRVFASRAAVVGRAIGDLDLPGEKARPYFTFAAATPISWRDRTSCSSSETASAFLPIAEISRRCASFSAIQSRAPPSSATSPSASAWRSASWSASSRSRFPASGNLRWDWRGC